MTRPLAHWGARTRALFVLLSALVAMRLPGGENLVTNPGFEQVEDERPAGWEIAKAANGGTAAPDRTTFHGGHASLLLAQSAIALPKGADEAPNLARFLDENKAAGSVLVRQFVPVEAGKQYHLRFWYKTEGLLRELRENPKQGYAHLLVFVFWMGSRNQSVEGDADRKYRWILNEGREIGDWTESVDGGAASSSVKNGLPLVAPEGATSVQIRFQLQTSAGGVAPRAWIDDVSLEEIGH